MFEHMVTMDPPDHTNARSLLNRLLTPKRLKENEDFMWRLADRHLDDFIADGKCEFLTAYAKPFSLLVIADLLGVPEEDHEEFRTASARSGPAPSSAHSTTSRSATNPLEWLDEKFISYLEDRRKNPRDDVLTALATAKYPDGSTPEVIEVVRSATFLFARRPGDHHQAARRGDEGARRPARHPAAAARGPQPHPDLRRGVRCAWTAR